VRIIALLIASGNVPYSIREMMLLGCFKVPIVRVASRAWIVCVRGYRTGESPYHFSVVAQGYHGGVTLGVAVGIGVAVGVDVGVAVGVAVAASVGCAVAVGVGVPPPPCACKSSTQSGSPLLLFPGVVKLWLPQFGNGEPGIAANVSAVGSYQRVVTRLLKLFSAIVSVCLTGV